MCNLYTVDETITATELQNPNPLKASINPYPFIHSFEYLIQLVLCKTSSISKKTIPSIFYETFLNETRAYVNCVYPPFKKIVKSHTATAAWLFALFNARSFYSFTSSCWAGMSMLAKPFGSSRSRKACCTLYSP